MATKSEIKNVDEYIAGFDDETRLRLEQIRQVIKKAAPAAEESISYMMPAYKYLGRPLVYFAGYKNHIGFYATPTGHDAFKKELSVYKQGKGSVQFPVEEKLPVSLINKMVKFRVLENLEQSKTKTKK
ncbi:MAG: DUF1801 domain-containing protein [Ferruginibacter sp.]|nr:DUF1801 domain-containing protein [Ferruginibacter sp.]